MRKAGVSDSVIMEITGHSTRQMFDRYNTVDVEDTRQAVAQYQDFLKNVELRVDQAGKNEDRELPKTFDINKVMANRAGNRCGGSA
jgi:hypothetical protein